MLRNDAVYSALKTLRHSLPEAGSTLDVDLGDSYTHWIHTVDRKLMPRLDPDSPLVVAICGGGSAGKSTLFNSLVGQSISPTGGRAGLNRRVLLAVCQARSTPVQQHHDLLENLSHTFGDRPQPLADPQQLLTPGPPLYCTSSALPAKVVLLDTPDIDTGARGVYANRGMARQSMEVSDLFIYIFTNATYNNRDNTDFLAKMLTGMGTRPCFLVYRVYPGFSDDEVREHALTVARHIYDNVEPDTILGLFRADEDNAVAAGAKPLKVKPISGSHGDLPSALAGLDINRMRDRLLGDMFAEAVAQARQMSHKVHEVKIRLDQYGQALVDTQGRCVQQALSRFPTDRVLRRFAKIWLDSDPAHIKFMRGTGRIVEWPLKTAVKAVRWFSSPPAAEKKSSANEDQDRQSELDRQLELDLLTAANKLYQKSIGSQLDSGSESIPAPTVVRPVQARLAKKKWQNTLETIMAQKEEILRWSDQLDVELKTLAHDLRARMGLLDQIRQTFAAALNVIPATAAVTYILHTGDPVGAAGIKVKLTGLFGLQDLYALIAIPMTAGLTKADRKQLEQWLGPVASTWLAHKLKFVQTLFKEQITGEILSSVQRARRRAAALSAGIDEALNLCESKKYRAL